MSRLQLKDYFFQSDVDHITIELGHKIREKIKMNSELTGLQREEFNLKKERKRNNCSRKNHSKL